MLVVLSLIGYFMVGSLVMGYNAAIRGEANTPWESPEPFFTGLFWPLTLPYYFLATFARVAPLNIGISLGLYQLEAEKRNILRRKEIERAKLLAEREIQVAMKELE
jgi:hypothetical protein